MSYNPTSKKLTFLQLLSNDSNVCKQCNNLEWQPHSKIEIPIIQRDYAQGRESKEELRKNFLNSLFEATNGKSLELDFVYGSLKDNVFQPLDGQQRLTTLFLLHWFVAVKEDKLDNELRKLLTKFTYETRTSSREFCQDLINKGIDFKNLIETDYLDKEKTKPKNNELSKTITNSYWFYLSWKKDPTIKSMLNMLDSIYHTFKDTKEVWDKLNNISFHYIELQNFGLSDDLYIKMNARGKPLTDFENFKAKFEQHITKESWESNAEATESFSHQIDTLWTDLFWNYRDKTENIFDEQLLNFFRTMAVINYTLKADKSKSDVFRTNIDLLTNNSKKVSFNQYLELGCFDDDYFKTLKFVLNKISDKSGLKTFLFDTTYVNEVEIFNGVIKNDLSYPDLVIAFAYYQYLALEEDIEIEKLTSWLRIVRNLVEGSRPYLFNNANDFANALRSINELLQHRNSIVDHFADTQINSLSGFISEQFIEEKLKAKLITQNDDWKNAIIEIENHRYFKGQIGFILDWCKDENGIHNIDKFKAYSEKSNAVFSNEGLNKFDNFLFERALLATGDYLLSKGKNLSFLINNERDISWKRLLRDNNQKREILKQLFDKVSTLNLTNDLQKIIDEFSDKNDWRYYFIKHHEMITVCGKEKLIRKNSDFDILLLKTTQTNGEHRTYYSYSLFLELNNPNLIYHHQNSTNECKYFEINGIQIAFNSNSKKFFWTENKDWVNTHEFDDRDSALSFIKELCKTN
ncbi:DUF262 domain-containing protein [Pedobacter puniceum]|uniref:DUF262 domain-containing protein n=1 Tax=Pedobacter puniceum TaxID=2666136 RepID=A0A7K0FR85_9SPHI|nr:DUF262 domain-containing protein [Pedobacter puniceum]MRX48263.1 DUF262 domain-containing protein [Pedobacter puniceum]